MAAEKNPKATPSATNNCQLSKGQRKGPDENSLPEGNIDYTLPHHYTTSILVSFCKGRRVLASTDLI